MYGFGIRYWRKTKFSGIGIGGFAADMGPPPGTSGAFSSDINNLYPHVWISHT